MEITITGETINRSAKTTIGDLDYTLNYGIQDSKVVNLNGTVKKVDVNLGSFSIYNQGENKPVNLNLIDQSTLEDKQAILADIYCILDQLQTQQA